MKKEKNMFIAFLLNLLFSCFEFVGGIFTGSIAISSDALHDLGDALSLGSSCIFEKISKKSPDNRYTFGYARFSVLGGFITTIVLIVGSILVVYNAILRLISPVVINYNVMIGFAIVGFVVNSLAVFFTHGGTSINQKAVYLHMLEDVLGWVIVLIGAIVMKFTNLCFFDPIMSIVLACFILYNAIKNLIEVLKIILLKTPQNIDVEHLMEHLTQIDGVIYVHHVHIWTIDGQNNYATLHAVVTSFTNEIKSLIKEELKEHGISHVTLELESEREVCQERTCIIVEPSIHKCHHCH